MSESIEVVPGLLDCGDEIQVDLAKFVEAYNCIGPGAECPVDLPPDAAGKAKLVSKIVGGYMRSLLSQAGGVDLQIRLCGSCKNWHVKVLRVFPKGSS